MVAVGDIVVSGAQLKKGTLGSTTSPFEVRGKVGTYGDIVIANTGNEGTENQMLERGEPGFNTLLHELGHALGLNHPIKYDPEDAAPAYPMPSDPGQRYTVMSYTSLTGFPGYPGSEGSATSYWVAAPMLYDILAIQYLYGPNTKNQADDNLGKDAYKFKTDADAIQAIWDAGGNDISTAGGDGRDLLFGGGRRLRRGMRRGNPLTRSQSIPRQFPVSASH